MLTSAVLARTSPARARIRRQIYTRLAHNAAARSAEDSVRHILRRRLAALITEDHRRFIEVEACNLIGHLRCTRDVYREFVEKRNCRPIIEAHWVVLRCAVFPTAVDVLREQVIEYARLTRIPGRELSILFGIPTRTCCQDFGDGFGVLRPPDLDDDTASTEEELQSLGGLVNEETLLWFRDIRDGGGVGYPLGGGPFAVDDALAIENSFALCGLTQQITLPTWLPLRAERWRQCTPWTDGLCNLFASVQEELLSQWRVLPTDSLAHELALKEKTSRFERVVVPADTEQKPRQQRFERKNFVASADYRTIRFRGKQYKLTRNQSKIVKLLHDAYERGTPAVGKHMLLEAVEAETSRVRDSFKNSPLWGKLVIPNQKPRGTYQLNLK